MADGDVLQIVAGHQAFAEPVVREYVATLTDEQIKTLPTVAVEIIPAPPAGFGIDVLRVRFIARITDGANVYTNIGAACALSVQRGAAAEVMAIFNDTYFGNNLVNDLLGTDSSVGIGGNTVFAGPGLDVGTPDWGAQPTQELRGDDVDSLNIRLKINDNVGNLTGGNAVNTLIVSSLYSLVALT